MIPNVQLFTSTVNKIDYPSKTYKIKHPSNIINENSIKVNILETDAVEVEETDRIDGFVDDLDALIQTIYLILSTERYKFIIYSWDYGVELLDLYGESMQYVIAELPRRIKEALTMDNRISNVTTFEFQTTKRTVYVKFTVVSNIGNVSVGMEVNV